MEPSEKSLEFAPFKSRVDLQFWAKLTELKLQEIKLDESPKKIHACYSHIASPTGESLSCCASLNSTSFDESRAIDQNSSGIAMKGTLYLFNTLDGFKMADKNQILKQHGHEVLDCIKNGEVFNDASQISTCILLAYIDIKKYHYYYWFAFPCLSYPLDIKLEDFPAALADCFTELQISTLEKLNKLNKANFENPSFLLEEIEESGEICIKWRHVRELKDTNLCNSNLILCFCDPSTDPKRPGWPLRNILTMWAFYRPSACSVKILCWRTRCDNGLVDLKHSLVLKVAYKRPEKFDADMFNVYGWEKNAENKLLPRFLNLSQNLKPERLASNAVSLNLQLMRWRLVPELNLDLLSKTSCLLFGAGTLGCNVARCLMGWGINKITFVDNSKVSYSNPVRQTLYNFDDCSSGGRNKAEAAALALKRIHPNVDAHGVTISVPMPGHPISQAEEQQIKTDVELIERLIKSHDVLFVLLDTREGRWLPSAFGALHKKLIISAALGFDSYLVMRHGVRSDWSEDDEAPPTVRSQKLVSGQDLGCYFCCDVMAPGDSLTNRTLDQQCTVARPGASFLAAGLAVELMVNTLQHPMGVAAPTLFARRGSIVDDGFNADASSLDSETCLGPVPHQIRGFMSGYEQITPVTQRFLKCTCCSRPVLKALQSESKMQFLNSIFYDSSVLERLTGLDQMKEGAESTAMVEWSDNDSSSSA